MPAESRKESGGKVPVDQERDQQEDSLLCNAVGWTNGDELWNILKTKWSLNGIGTIWLRKILQED